MKIGVILIGSLFWDSNEMRKKWRDEFLDLERTEIIELPIRYGRKSSTWNNNYTMVFSSECFTKSYIGKGKLIPFKMEANNESELIDLAFKLAEVERKRPIKAKQSLSFSFFTIGYITNPKLNFKLEKINRFIEVKAEEYDLNENKKIINADGTINLDWQTAFEKFDVIITTVVKPGCVEYPNSETIAKAMIGTNTFDYFKNNIENNIITFQDSEIQNYLRIWEKGNS